MNHNIQFAREHGYVQTIKGRKRYLKDINSKNFTVRGFAERNAINSPSTGSGRPGFDKTCHDWHSPRVQKTKPKIENDPAGT